MARQDNQQSNNSSQSGNNQQSGSNRGFAAMDQDQQREIASQGGKASHASGNAHEFTSEEAREAGRKGGQSSGGGNQSQGGGGGQGSSGKK